MSRTKRNRKKATAKKGRNKKPKLIPNEKKEPHNADKTDNKNKKNSNDDITAAKTKLMVRRYEEFHEQFLPYDKIVQFLQKTQKCNPNLVDIDTIGNSAQGKPIYMVSITTNLSCSPGDPKMGVFIEAGLNGENSIAVSNTLYMIEYLTKNINFLKIMDYYIVPCCNPDAYDKFIKSRQKGSNKSSCDSDKKRAKTDIPENNEEDKGITDSDSSLSDDSGATKNNCDGTSADSISSIMPRPDWPSSNEYLNDVFCDSFEEENTKYFTYCKSANNKGQEIYNFRTTPKKIKTNNACNKQDTKRASTTAESTGSIRMDLSLNFPVVLGINDMQRIPTATFIEKIKSWKEKFTKDAPETGALLKVINCYQFAIKLLISLQEGGQAICYPYGFCEGTSLETNNLKEVARKGKSGITNRTFEFGSLFDIQGLTYGHLIDFLKVDKSAIKYMYVIKVHKKTPRYSEADELKHLMRYGSDIMECVKRMACAVYKEFTDLSVKDPRKVETHIKRPKQNEFS